jgi:hypothetical protein
MDSEILHLSTEVLGRICFFLNDSSFLAVLSLHPLISTRLGQSGGLLHYDLKLQYPEIRANPNLCRFSSLLSLRIVFDQLNCSFPPSYLTSLPKTLKQLQMKFPQALSIWRTFSPKPEDFISLANTCPVLEFLSIVGNQRSAARKNDKLWVQRMLDTCHGVGETIENLPTTLQHLYLSPLDGSLPSSTLRHLTNLESLKLPNSPSFQALDMPQTLTRFKILEFTSNAGNELTKLPSTLHTLIISFKQMSFWIPSMKMDCAIIPLLPKRLHTLQIEYMADIVWKESEASDWPPNLKKLKVVADQMSSAVDLMSKLPSSLTHVELVEHKKRGVSELWVPPDTVTKLPPLLETLIVDSVQPMFFASYLALLPKSIQHLDLNYDLDRGPSSDPFTVLSPKLVHFSWTVPSSGLLSMIPSIPRTLTSIKLKLNKDHFVQKELAHLPSNVTRLAFSSPFTLMDYMIDLLPKSINFVSCDSLFVTGHYSSNDEEQTEASFRQTTASRWIRRFPTNKVPELILESIHVPAHCTSLDLENSNVSLESVASASRLASLVTSDFIHEISQTGHEKAILNILEATQSTFQYFPNTLTHLELTDLCNSLEGLIPSLPPTLKTLLARKSNRLGAWTKFPVGLETLELDSEWSHDLFSRKTSVTFPPGLTHLALKAIDRWYMKFLPSLQFLSVQQFSFNSGGGVMSRFSEILPRQLTSLRVKDFIAFPKELPLDELRNFPPQLENLDLGNCLVPIEALDLLPKSLLFLWCDGIWLSSLQWASHYFEPNGVTVALNASLLNCYVTKRNQSGDAHFSVHCTNFYCDFNPSHLHYLPSTTKRLSVAPNLPDAPDGAEWSSASGLFEKSLPSLEQFNFMEHFIPELAIPLLPKQLQVLSLVGEFPHSPSSVPGLSSTVYGILPPSLKRLAISKAPPLNREDAMKIPRQLESLSLTKRKEQPPVPSDAIPFLPRSLTDLDIPDTWLDQESIPDLPPNLTSLNIYKPNSAMLRYISILDARSFM